MSIFGPVDSAFLAEGAAIRTHFSLLGPANRQNADLGRAQLRKLKSAGKLDRPSNRKAHASFRAVKRIVDRARGRWFQRVARVIRG